MIAQVIRSRFLNPKKASSNKGRGMKSLTQKFASPRNYKDQKSLKVAI